MGEINLVDGKGADEAMAVTEVGSTVDREEAVVGNNSEPYPGIA